MSALTERGDGKITKSLRIVTKRVADCVYFAPSTKEPKFLIDDNFWRNYDLSVSWITLMNAVVQPWHEYLMFTITAYRIPIAVSQMDFCGLHQEFHINAFIP
jgi:hypothetical protein